MKITWYGQSCFLIEGASTSVVIDPYGPGIGILPPLRADVVVVTHDHFDHNYVQAVSGRPEVVTAIGEYFVKGAKFTGYPTYHDSQSGARRGRNIVWQIETDGLRLAHLGDLGEPLADDLVAALAGADILMVPVGGHFTIDVPDVLKVIESVSPRTVVPMHYRSPISPADSILEPLDVFCTAIGGCPKPQAYLDIKSGDVSPGRIVVLNVSRG